MRKKIRQAAAWLLTAAMVFSGGISNGVSAWAETAGEQNALASSSNANRVSMKTKTASASDSSKENDFVTASSSDAVKINLASASDSVEYTQEFLTAEGILITIESDDSIWSDETTIEVTKVSSSDVTKMNNLVASELGERQSVSAIYAYDITFYDDGEEFEPDGTIKVTFSLPEVLMDVSSEAEIFHVNDSVTKVDLMETILEEENTWSCIAEGFSVYGVAVTASSYTEIYTVEDLQNIKYNLGSTYYLMNDIDLSGIDWSPIEYRSESRSDQFYGTFDGQGYTISGLSLTIDNNQSSSSEDNTVYAGLFGDIAGTIKNLNISDFSFNITSNVNGVGSCTYVGCITSGLANGSVENCHVSDSEIQVVTDTGAEIGGIAGYNHSGTISNCSFDGEITHKLSDSGSQYTYMGGICGNIGSANSYIEKCINYGSITGKSSNSATNLCIGGVLGGSFIIPCNIDQCANYGDVVVEADPAYEGYGYAEAGGIVGSLYTNATYDDNVITNCYNAGSISAESTLSDSIYCCAGGIVGYSVPSVEITNCYNLSEINGAGYNGSIIGYLAGSEIGKCEYNYYYAGLCKLALGGAEGVISLNAVGYFLPQIQNMATYEGFDFDNIWEMGSDDYPYPIFQWQNESDISYDEDDEISDNFNDTTTEETDDNSSGETENSSSDNVVSSSSNDNDDSSDSTQNGLTNENGSLYYYSNGQKVINSWQEFDYDGVGFWRYFGEDGAMLVGWVEIDGEYYYFSNDSDKFTYGCYVPTKYLIEEIINDSKAEELGSYTYVASFLDDVDFITELAYSFASTKEYAMEFINTLCSPDVVEGDFLDSVTQNFMTDTEQCKKQLKSLLDKMENTDTITSVSSNTKNYISLLLDTTENIYDSKYGNLSENLQWDTGAFDTITNRIIETFNVSDAFINSDLNDYSRHMEILESLKSCVPSNSKMAEIIDSAIFEYQNQFALSLTDVIISEMSEGYIKDVDLTSGTVEINYTKIADKILGTSFNTSFTIIDLVTDNFTSANVIEDIVYSEIVVSSSLQALHTAQENVKNASVSGTTEEINEAIANYINIFEIAKAAKLMNMKQCLVITTVELIQLPQWKRKVIYKLALVC